MTSMGEVTARNGQPSAASLSSLVDDFCRTLDKVLEDWSFNSIYAASDRMAAVNKPLITYISQAQESRDQPTDEEKEALAFLRKFVNDRDPNTSATRLDFSERDAGTDSSNNPSQSNECTMTGRGMSETTTKHVSGKHSSEQELSGLSMKKATHWELPHICRVNVKTQASEVAVVTPRTPFSRHDAASETPTVNSSVNHEGTDPCPNHHSRTNGGNKNGDSDAEDRVRARKQKRKEKHQAEKDATATKKKGRFSATDNVATEDALGVEEMESALQIARHPPKPSRSKQNQGQKTKRQRQVKSQRVRRNEAKAMAQVGGSRCVLNKDVKSYAGRNECFAKRTCLPDAVVALLPPELKQQASCLYAAMPKDRDAAPLDLRIELCRLGLSLERATPNYVKKGHAPAHLLLQERTCKLVVHVRLTDADENRISHFVAWDGSTVIDHPYNVRVNSTSDRSSPVKSQEAFDKLFKRYYKRWQITSVHRLRQRNTHEICKH